MKRVTRIGGGTAALAATAAVSVLVLGPTADARTAPAAQKPTVVLVHGAWGDAAGWTPVAERLEKDGYTVKAPPNPLRGLTYDADYINSVLKQIKGPVILVGHSYGGAVITNAVKDDPNVKALVYIAAFAPDAGDSLATLNAKPVPHAIPPVPAVPSTFPQQDGTEGTELTIDPAKYPGVFLNNEVPRFTAEALAAEQRPLSLDSVNQTSGAPAWQTVKSFYMVAKQDHAISPNLERFMAARAHAKTVEVNGPHLIMYTNPAPVTRLIEEAAHDTVH
ncbi:alpha/beta hydrolase [Streptomyces sp. NBC_01476]|uniref:alpha/beta fold hydrolase n=1 Tax=Streptomyces sp. NBC_01476 TaxID=2903881 RepID=UPI002E347D5F|nr:alpha/beta hydrolase [Streptomyces sp. NBC_01476]